LKISDKEIRKYYNSKHRVHDSLEKIKTNLKEKKILLLLRKIIFEKGLKDYKVKLTEKEFRESVKNIYGNGNTIQKQMKKEQQVLYAIVSGVEKTLKYPSKQKEIFNKEVLKKTGYDYEYWKLILNSLSTPKKLLEFKKNIPKNEDDIYNNSRKSLFPILLKNKFEKILTKNVVLSKYELEVIKNKYKFFKNNIRYIEALKKNQLETKKNNYIKNWYKKEYSTFSIYLYHKKYQYIYKKLLEFKKLYQNK
jgi:hypothetical protein